MTTYLKAVHALVGGQMSGAANGPLSEINFFDNQVPPTEEQIQAKIIELQADHDSKQYQRDRADAYPSWQDQLDNIFHNGIDAWKADIQAIKDQFPKP
jgi:hypothetical protein